MRAVRRLVVLLALTTIGSVICASPAAAISAVQHQQTSPGLDNSDANIGGWDNTTPGTAGRPFIKYFAINNGGSDIVIVNNTGGSPAQTPTPVVSTCRRRGRSRNAVFSFPSMLISPHVTTVSCFRH